MTPKSHTLRLHMADYDAIASGANTLLPYRDRRFTIGDHVELLRYTGPGWYDIDPNAPILEMRIAQVCRGVVGLLPGYVVLELRKVEPERRAA